MACARRTLPFLVSNRIPSKVRWSIRFSPHFLLYAFLLLTVKGHAQGEINTNPSSLELEVDAIVNAIQLGDFESALESYGQAYQLALSQHAEEEFWELCSRRCPYYLGQIAWLIGANQSDFKFLTQALDEITSDAHREGWRDAFHRFAFAHLGETERPRRSPTNTMPLYFREDDSGDQRALTIIRAGKRRTALWAAVDTGRSAVYFEQLQAEKESIQYDVVRDAFTAHEWDGRQIRLHQVILQDLTLGRQSETNILSGMYHSDTPIGLGDQMILGTLPLLRHNSVCFDWEGRVLHLGYLGPCGQTGRVSPYKSWLHSHAMTPMVQVKRPGASDVVALIDTGSDMNLCKPSTAGEGLEASFSFGEHASLTSECSPGVSPVVEDYLHDMVIGMETLSRFAAFGWELNPFRMYFVPRTDGSTTRSASFLENAVAELQASAEQGDFQAALAAQRRALRFSLSTKSARRDLGFLCSGTCPWVGQLGWLVGADPLDFEFLKAYAQVGKDARLRDAWIDYADLILFRHLGQTAGAPRSPSTSLTMTLGKESAGTVRPWAWVQLTESKSPFTAVIDTGTSLVTFYEEFVAKNLTSFQPLTEYSASKTRLGTNQRTRSVMLDRILIGGTDESPVMSTLIAPTSDGPQESTLGNRPLLRHNAICFAWEKKKLYLGELGPCNAADRVSASGSLLHPQKLVPTVQFDADGRGELRALLSTGSPSNHCKEEMAGRTFNLGDHELLTVRCDANAEPISDDYEFDMIIGMETLAGFSAFGWELNPFRTYFVPRSPRIE